MKLNLTRRQRLFLVIAGFTLAIIGFMIKLPWTFRTMDKELHAVFYFLAAAFLNILFAGTRLVRHVVIFVSLYLFGMAIEFAQAYSNKFFRRPIHGRFDPEDVQWNLKGLMVFSLLWVFCVVVISLYHRATMKRTAVQSKKPLP